MNDQELLNQLNNGEVEVAEGGSSKYEEALIEVVKAELLVADKKEDLYPINQDWAQGQICLRVELRMLSDSYPLGKVYPFADIYVNKNKQPACYESYVSKTDKDDDDMPAIKRGKLLWELKEAIKVFNPQSKFNQEGWMKNFKPSDLLGCHFKMEIRYATKKNGEEFVILNDSFQKLKDERYKQTRTIPAANEEKLTETELGDLPF